MLLFFYKLLHIPSRVFLKPARQRAWLLFSLVCCATFSGALQGALDRVGDFALLDDRGIFHQLSRYQHRAALAVMAYDSSCAEMGSMLDRFAALDSSYRDQGIDFVLLDARDLGREVARALDLPLPLLEDDGQLVSETLEITRAGDVLVLNPQRLSVYYRGDSSEALDGALNAVVDGRVDDTMTVETAGCSIDFPIRSRHLESPPDYVSEVAPIVIENCLDCHVQGGVGPFAMDSYIMLLGWSPMIREVLLNKRMPPMQVDPYVGHSASARGVSKQDLQTLIHWIDAGAPRGEGEIDPLEQHMKSDDGWVLGEPDYIVKGPEHSIPSTGVLDYYYNNIELPFTEDKWVKAVQYRAGDPSVLHHLITFVSEPEEDFWGQSVTAPQSAVASLLATSPVKIMSMSFLRGSALLSRQVTACRCNFTTSRMVNRPLIRLNWGCISATSPYHESSESKRSARALCSLPIRRNLHCKPATRLTKIS